MVRPYRMTGSVVRTNLCRIDQILLCICIYIYPDAQADQICAFIVAISGRTYSCPNITKRFNELNLTRKISSYEAYRTNAPTNTANALQCASLLLLLDGLDIHLDYLLDVDETCFYLYDVKTKYKWAHSSYIVRHTSRYTRSKSKTNVIIDIELRSQLVALFVDNIKMFPRRRLFISQTNFNQYIFGDFIDSVLNSIENVPVTGDVDDDECFMWDNLSL